MRMLVHQAGGCHTGSLDPRGSCSAGKGHRQGTDKARLPMTSRVCSPRGRPDPGPLREHEGGHTAVQTDGCLQQWSPENLEALAHRSQVTAGTSSPPRCLCLGTSDPGATRPQNKSARKQTEWKRRAEPSRRPPPAVSSARPGQKGRPGGGEKGTVLGTRRGSFRFHTHVFLCKHMYS